MLCVDRGRRGAGIRLDHRTDGSSSGGGSSAYSPFEGRPYFARDTQAHKSGTDVLEPRIVLRDHACTFLATYRGTPTANAGGAGSNGKVLVRRVSRCLQIDVGPRRSLSAYPEKSLKIMHGRGSSCRTMPVYATILAAIPATIGGLTAFPIDLYLPSMTWHHFFASRSILRLDCHGLWASEHADGRTPRTRVDPKAPKDAPHRDLSDAALRFGPAPPAFAVGHAPKGC